MNKPRFIEPVIEQLLPLINKGNKRLCHKVRIARYYDGVATIDVVGCYLDCGFCWVPEFKRLPDEVKNRLSSFKYMTPEETSKILIDVANKNGLKSVRLSGGEPTLNPQHLLETIQITTDAGYNYIFETNGLLLDDELVHKLTRYRNKVFVYYGLKGASPDMFYRLTCRDQIYWEKTLNGLTLLIRNNFTLGINIMSDFLIEGELLQLIGELLKIDEFAPLALDIKKTSIFPHVRKRLEERKIKYSIKRIEKKAFDKFIKEHYPDVFQSGNPYRINMGIMNFLDFQRAHNNRKA